MKRKSILKGTIIFSILFLTACQAGNQAQPSIPMLTEPPPTQAAGDTLSLSNFKNSEFYGLYSGKTVTLTDGVYEDGTGADYLLMQLLPQAAFGDLNDDGREDAVLLLSENMGGSGVFVTLNVMMATESGFTQLAPVLVDDRPLIDSVLIEDGRVILNAVIHSVSDAMTDPTEQVEEIFSYSKGTLVLVDMVSVFNGVTRSIVIDAPLDEQEVSGTVRVSGSMPVAPFENNLIFRIYDEKNNPIKSEAFMVTSSDIGGAATFDNTITLPDIEPGSRVRLELSEESMADGSTLCLASVVVYVK